MYMQVILFVKEHGCFQAADADIIDLGLGEKQLLEWLQVLEVNQSRRGDPGSEVEFLKVESFAMNQVGTRDPALTEIDTMALFLSSSSILAPSSLSLSI